MLLATPLLIAAAVTASGAAVNTLSVPSPSNSSVTACVELCPFGDVPVKVVVRDFNNLAIAGSFVVLDFTGCGGAICAPKSSDPYQVSGATVLMVTNLTGTALFPLRASRLCGATNHMRVFADGVQLADRTVSSPDQNGDLVVDASDLALFDAKAGTADATADFDCSGTVTTSERSHVLAHLEHNCLSPVPALPRSWGRMKLLYR